MSRQDWANLGEAIGGIAVLITLVYLARQIRQNSRMVRAATYQQVVDSLADFSALLMQNGDLADLYSRGSRLGLASLNEIDRERRRNAFMTFFRRVENIFYQQTQGTLDPPAWAGIRASLRDVLGRPGVQQWWRETCHRFNPEFVAFVAGDLLPKSPEAAAQQGTAAGAAQLSRIDPGSALASTTTASPGSGGAVPRS